MTGSESVANADRDRDRGQQLRSLQRILPEGRTAQGFRWNEHQISRPQLRAQDVADEPLAAALSPYDRTVSPPAWPRYQPALLPGR
jgi:hypothetical protein